MNEEQVINVRTDYTIPMAIICQWLKMLKEKTKNKDIESALSTIRFAPNVTEAELSIATTIRQLYISEMNGDLNPPPSMRDVYDDIETYCQKYGV